MIVKDIQYWHNGSHLTNEEPGFEGEWVFKSNRQTTPLRPTEGGMHLLLPMTIGYPLAQEIAAAGWRISLVGGSWGPHLDGSGTWGWRDQDGQIMADQWTWDDVPVALRPPKPLPADDLVFRARS